MGAFMIWDVTFKNRKDRYKFEKLTIGYRTSFILVDEISDSGGFVAWLHHRNPSISVVYYMGFMGYAEYEDILKDCKKKGIKIIFLAQLGINDRNSKWEKIKGKWN